MDYRQLYAKKKSYEKQLLKANPYLSNISGIYMLTREEDGIKYAYIGQAVHILDRLVSHMMGYEQWIDRSLKKHKIYSIDNPNGWIINWAQFPIDELDEKEKMYIRRYANEGFQLRNKTLGGQGQGKCGTENNKQAKGYREGVAAGRKQLAKELKHIIDLHLQVTTKTDKIPDDKALTKFWYLILKELEEK